MGGGESGLINEVLIAKKRDQAKVSEILAAIGKARSAIEASSAAGRDVIFGGAINAKTGKPISDSPTDDDLLSMSFPVQGVTGASFFGS